MSTNLNAPALVGGQANPETTVNDAIGALDAAMTEKFVVDLTNDDTLTAAEYRSAFLFSVTPTGVTKTLTLPLVQRMCFIQNDGDDDITVTVGTTDIPLLVGEGGFFYTDGTTNGLALLSSGGGGGGGDNDFDFAVFVPGIPVASQLLFRHKVIRDFSWPASLTDSAFDSTDAATAAYTVTLKNNGSSIGTLVWAIAGTTPTVTFASQVDFVVGDVITVEGAATPDATIKGITLSFAGTKA